MGIAVRQSWSHYANLDHSGAEESAIWVKGDGDRHSDVDFILGPDEARELAKNLVEQAKIWDKRVAEFKEANKPKLPTALFSIIEWPNGTRFIRVSENTWRTEYNVMDYRDGTLRSHEFKIISEGLGGQ